MPRDYAPIALEHELRQLIADWYKAHPMPLPWLIHVLGQMILDYEYTFRLEIAVGEGQIVALETVVEELREAVQALPGQGA